MRVLPRLLLAAALASTASACATPPPASEPEALAEYRQTNDPLEPTNRVFYRVNNALDTVILAPVARAYRYAVPEDVRNPVHNLLRNITSPVLFANDVMQAKPRRAGDTLMRFVINTTAGVGGLFDVAKDVGYPAHDNDFGTTLALWGVPEGPFLFLPVIGPSDPRDATGYGADIALDPFTWASFGGSNAFGYSRYGVGAVDARERALDTVESVKRTALDPYATFRSLYRQNRRAGIEKARQDERETVPNWFSR